ncbi:MAG TPA: potassium channel family protein [Streptosporangiaceae bacterium]|nr:potassium channel family protein [Streptosporangiaceae bacterium]
MADNTGNGGRPANHARPPRRPLADQDRFGLLLVLLICTYVVSAFTKGRWTDGAQVVLYGAAAILSLRTSDVPKRYAGIIAAGLLAGTAIMVALALISRTGLGIANIWVALVMLFVVCVIVYSVLSKDEVTIQSIYGAFSAYMILGLMFSSIFSAIDHLGGGHFFAHGEPANTETFQYFSFTTLTTLGYGDFTAAGPPGRAIAVLEALTGQVFLATLVARLVAAFRSPRQRAQ